MPTTKELERAHMIDSIMFVLKDQKDMSFHSMINTIFQGDIPENDSEVSSAVMEWAKTISTGR